MAEPSKASIPALPNSTGGIGTALFSVLGAILVLSSTILILAKHKQEVCAPRH